MSASNAPDYTSDGRDDETFAADTGLTLNGDIEREDLELLVERDNPTAWIAEALLNEVS